MRTNRWNLALGLALILGTALACNFSATTANISKLKIGKDKDVNTETKTFAPKDTIYGQGTISNTSSKQKVKIRLLIDDVEGQKSGEVFPGTEATTTVDGATTVPLNFTPPPNGWPAGKYKVEFTMYDESGNKQVDQKTESVTVSS